jgi:hypothetical protein
VEQRPLEGFVFAVTPFNFTSHRRQSADRACADAATPSPMEAGEQHRLSNYYVMQL